MLETIERESDREAAIDRNETAAGDLESAYSIRSLARGLAILRCFTVDHPEWGVTELSKHLRLNKATIYRLVKTLESEGFLTSDSPGSKYYVGSALLRVAFVGLSSSELRRVARPHMERLAAETGETVDLSIWTSEGVLFIDQVLTSRPFRPVASVGRVFSDYSNAHAKVFLAFMPEEECSRALAQPQRPMTPFSIVDSERLSRELRKVAAEGVAYDLQEQAEGVCGLAAPVIDPVGAPAASLAIVLPASRYGAPEAARLTALLKDSAAAIARDMGYEHAAEA